MANYSTPGMDEESKDFWNPKGHKVTKKIDKIEVAQRDQEGVPSAYYFYVGGESGQKAYVPKQRAEAFKESNSDLFAAAHEGPTMGLGDQEEVVDMSLASRPGPMAGDGEGNNGPTDQPQMGGQQQAPQPIQYATTTVGSGGTTTQTSQNVIDPKDRAAYEKSSKAYQEGINSLQDLHTSQVREQTATNNEIAFEKEMYLHNQQAERNLEVQIQQEEKDKADKMMQEARVMNADPSRMWKNMSDGRKATAAFAVLVGGLGQALTGAKNNAALDILERAIDRDIDAQMVDIENARWAAEEQREVARDKSQEIIDNDRQREAQRIAKWDAFADQANAIAQKYEGLIKGQTAANAGALFANKSAESQMRLNMKTETITKSKQWQSKTVPVAGSGTGGKQLSEGTIADLAKKKATIEQMLAAREAWSNGKISSGAIGLAKRKILENDNLRPFFKVSDEDAEAWLKQNIALVTFVNTVSGQSMTTAEFDRYRSMLGRLGDDPALNKVLINNFIDKEINEYRSLAGSYQKSKYDVSAFDPNAYNTQQRATGGSKKEKYGGK